QGGLLLLGQPQIHVLVVVFHHLVQSRKSSVMIKTSLAMGEQAAQRGGAIAWFTGTAFCLKIIHPNFCRRVQVPSWFGEQRWHMARGAFRFAREELLPARGGFTIEVGCRRRGRGQRQLV